SGRLARSPSQGRTWPPRSTPSAWSWRARTRHSAVPPAAGTRENLANSCPMSHRAVFVSLAALTAVAVTVLVPPAQALGPELLPNGGFEQGTNTMVVAGFDQPLLPVGWAFEGSAGLFD